MDRGYPKDETLLGRALKRYPTGHERFEMVSSEEGLIFKPNFLVEAEGEETPENQKSAWGYEAKTTTDAALLEESKGGGAVRSRDRAR